MSNVITKIIPSASFCLILLIGCSKDKNQSETTPETTDSSKIEISSNTTSQSADSALLLSQQIDNCLQDGLWKDAIMLIDSLNNTYVERADLRRNTLVSRAKAIEGQTMDSIAIVDARFASAELEMDSLKRFFTAVRDPRLSGYIIDKNASVDLMGGNAVQPRLEDSYNPWVLEVSVKGHPGIKGLRAFIGGKTVEIKPLHDMKSRRIEGADVELFSFSGDEVEPLARRLDGRSKSNIKLTILGEKGNTDISLTPAIQNAIWRIYRYAELRDRNSSDLVHRQYLENRLITARDQIARYTTYN